MLPLSIAILPWGLLAGSYAVDSGLTPFDSQALSAILFAGSAQLVAISMFKAGIGLFSMLATILFISLRHLLYSVSMRSRISPLALHWRIILGFLLTDELFAVCSNKSEKRFSPWYALGAGLSVYIIWNLATLAGIVAGNSIPQLNRLGLDFAVAATFIAITIPAVKNSPTLVTVVVALIAAVVLNYFHIPASLIIASVLAMLAGYITENLQDRQK